MRPLVLQRMVLILCLAALCLGALVVLRNSEDAMDQPTPHPIPTLSPADLERYSAPPQLLQRIESYQQAITALAVDPSQRYLASAGGDGLVSIWQLPEATLVYSYTHADGVLALAFADQHRLVSGSFDKTVRVVDYRAQQPLQTIAMSHIVNNIAVDPTYSYLAVGVDYDNIIQIFSWPALQPVKTLTGEFHEIRALAFNASGTALHARFLGVEHATWEVPGWNEISSFSDEHMVLWSDTAITHDARLLATSSDVDTEVQLWNTLDGTKVQTIEVTYGDPHYNPKIALRADGAVLASAALDDEHEIRLWNVATSASLVEWPSQHDEDDVIAMVLSDPYLVTGDIQGRINIWRFP